MFHLSRKTRKPVKTFSKKEKLKESETKTVLTPGLYFLPTISFLFRKKNSLNDKIIKKLHFWLIVYKGKFHKNIAYMSRYFGKHKPIQKYPLFMHYLCRLCYSWCRENCAKYAWKRIQVFIKLNQTLKSKKNWTTKLLKYNKCAFLTEKC